jgi:hypothetical protein
MQYAADSSYKKRQIYPDVDIHLKVVASINQEFAGTGR